MQIITDLDELAAKISECNDALTYGSDDAMRRVFAGFPLDLSAQAPADPFSPEYRSFQMALHERVSGRPYTLESERTLFIPENFRRRPFPWSTRSAATAGNHLHAVASLLRALDLPPGARVVEFGPGWGNSTVAMALVGLQVTAVELEPNFCEVLRERAAHEEVGMEVVNSDFFWAERVTEPFDAAVFFECFHHCDDHMRLLRALHAAVKPGAAVILASEPIVEGYPIPWGVRTDGEALWAMRNFGWLELGFSAAYFRDAAARAGWIASRRDSLDLPHAAVWVLRRAADGPASTVEAATAEPPPASGTAGSTGETAALKAELAAMRTSTSWRVTAPLRRIRRLAAGV